MSTPIEFENWGKLLVDAQKLTQTLQLVEDSHVLIQAVPMLRAIEPPCITLTPGDRISQRGTLTEQCDFGYGINLAYIQNWNRTTDTKQLGEDFRTNQTLWGKFHWKRNWAPTLGGALLYSTVETSEFMLREAADENYAVQYFIIRAWVRENL